MNNTMMKHTKKYGSKKVENTTARKNRKSSKSMALMAVIFSTIVIAFIAGSVIVKGENKSIEGSYTKHFVSVRVEAGDSLWSISQEYMDTVHYDSIYDHMQEVVNTNHLTTDQLKIGQYLIVPYYTLDSVSVCNE